MGKEKDILLINLSISLQVKLTVQIAVVFLNDTLINFVEYISSISMNFRMIIEVK